MRYRLKDIFDLQMGKTPARQNMKYWDKSDCKWISIADLSRSEKYISNTKEKISDIAVKETGIRVIPANTVIMSFKLSIGKVAITADNMYSNEAIMAFNDKHVVEMLPEYIFYMFKYMRWDSGSNNAVMGKTLNKATISEIEIDICSIKKQQDIVAILDKMDNILSNKYKNIYLLDELVKARFVEMFGNPVSNEKRWVTEAMHKVAPIVNYKGNIGNEIWLLNLDMVEAQTGRILEYIMVPKNNIGSSICQFDTSNVLYSKLRPYLNKVVIPDRCGCATSEMLPLQPVQEKLNRTYFAYMLRNNEFVSMINEKVSGAKMPRVSMDELKNFKVPLPTLKMQNEFADFVRQADKSKAVIEKSLKELETLQASLMQKYFS